MKNRLILQILTVYIIIRIFFAILSSYGYLHGWNEGWYSLIAKNYFNGSFWEQIAYLGGSPFSSAPPLFSYAVYASFKIFGISDLSARLVSILSEIIAVLGVSILAKEQYNEKTATLASIIFIFIPWNVLWFGRVQTDPLMTALMTLAIALYVRAYRNDNSMLPFGIILGLAVFTKQPALAALTIVLIWSYFEGIKKEAIQKALIYFFIGLVPLFTWLSYYLVIGNTSFVNHFIYGELTNRSLPFSDVFKVVVSTFLGISPIVFLFFLYEIIKIRDIRKNPLIPWLLLFGIFVIVRTPPSHEYYSLPLMPVIAIIAARGTIRFTDVHPSMKSIILGMILLSTIPVSYALLSYTGDMGYTGTRDAALYINDYIEKHPGADLLVVTQVRYMPQLIWYANLTAIGYSNKQIYVLSDDLSKGSVIDMEEIVNKTNVTAIFLVIDDRGELQQRISDKYIKVFSYRYETILPNLAGMYTRENQTTNRFGQTLKVYKLK